MLYAKLLQIKSPFDSQTQIKWDRRPLQQSVPQCLVKYQQMKKMLHPAKG